jgi:hypothetical protein
VSISSLHQILIKHVTSYYLVETNNRQVQTESNIILKKTDLGKIIFLNGLIILWWKKK